MKMREITKDVYWLGALDWDRRLFDSLIPLPDGTTYNAYLVKGTEKTVLMDSVDPAMSETLMEQLAEVRQIDYVVCHHAEQDHSGTIPMVLEKYPDAAVLCTPKCKSMLIDHLAIDPGRITTVEDGQTVSLGGKTLQFIYTPWVHWPETMCSWLPEDRILFTCDFFGSHIASTDLFVRDEARVYEAAKRYYSEIMMPFRKIIQGNIKKIENLDIALIAPSHGSIYDKPDSILNAYKDWISDKPHNSVVIPFISMHGSVRKMVGYLVGALAARDITVYQFDLAVTDIGKLAIALVDASTIVVGTPTVHAGVHPAVGYAASLANMIKPKAKYASVIGSYGWHSKAVEQVAASIPNLKVEILTPVMSKGVPGEADFAALEQLAEQIAEKHKNSEE
jgi:flavorubredoxin